VSRLARVGLAALCSFGLLLGAAGAEALAATGPQADHPKVSTRSAPRTIPSIFTSSAPQYVGAGWRTCATPITWTVDTRELSSAMVDVQIANLNWAFAEWSRVTGLTFTYAGTQSLSYEEANHHLLPADGTTTTARHIYIKFAHGSAAGFTGNVDGLASPSLVMPSTKEILQGRILLRSEYFANQGKKPSIARAINVHEIGHVLGLSHSTSSKDVMYPIVADKPTLSEVDVASTKALLQPCPAS